MDYEGKNVIITGGSRGIGLATARLFAAKGANVTIVARDIENLQKAIQVIRENCQTEYQIIAGLPVDVTAEKDLSSELRVWIAKNGAPDIVINSAGFAYPGEVTNIPIEIFQKTMNVNYFGTVNTVKMVLPSMLSKGSGTIVNISSAGGFLGIYGYTAYSGSKFAVTGFSDALRNELKPRGIHVCIVFPPDTDTDQLAYESQFKPDVTREIAGIAGLMTPDKVAKSILDGIEKHKYVITPSFETKIIYWLQNFLGEKAFDILDLLAIKAWKKVTKNKSDTKIKQI